MAKTIIVTIDGKATTYAQPDGHENDGRVFELAREGLRTAHLEVMRLQDERRFTEHQVRQEAILAEQKKAGGGRSVRGEGRTLTPEPIAVKTSGMGAAKGGKS